jgi:hypothetical protein
MTAAGTHSWGPPHEDSWIYSRERALQVERELSSGIYPDARRVRCCRSNACEQSQGRERTILRLVRLRARRLLLHIVLLQQLLLVVLGNIRT